MSLTPFLSLSIEKLKAENTLSELVHNIAPEHSVNLMLLEAEQSVHIRQSSQVKTTSVSSAFFITCRDCTEFFVPGITLLVAAFKLLIVDGIGELVRSSISVSHNELADTMTEQLVAGNMDLVATDCVLRKDFTLLRSSKLD